jgi:hypothetical protein
MWNKPTDPKPAFVFDTLLAGVGFGRMLVTAERGDGSGGRWLKVELPIRPNGADAWVRGDQIQVVPRHDELVIDLSNRTLTHIREGKVLDRFRVGVGQPQYPTAIGTFYVWQKVNFDQWYGPYGNLRARAVGVLPGSLRLAGRRTDGHPRHLRSE